MEMPATLEAAACVKAPDIPDNVGIVGHGDQWMLASTCSDPDRAIRRRCAARRPEKTFAQGAATAGFARGLADAREAARLADYAPQVLGCRPQRFEGESNGFRSE
jgi:hypothetical protein